MKNKSINQVSIINGEDGPTSVFIFGEAQKQSLKIRIRNAIYQSRRNADYKRALRQEIYYALKYGLTDSMIHSGCTDFFLGGEPDAALYLRHLRGKVNFVLQVEPQNQWFLQAKEDLDPQNPKINWCFQEKTRR